MGSMEVLWNQILKQKKKTRNIKTGFLCPKSLIQNPEVKNLRKSPLEIKKKILSFVFFYIYCLGLIRQQLNIRAIHSFIYSSLLVVGCLCDNLGAADTGRSLITRLQVKQCHSSYLYPFTDHSFRHAINFFPLYCPTEFMGQV